MAAMGDFWDDKITFGGSAGSPLLTSLLTGQNVRDIRAQQEMQSRMSSMASQFAQSSSASEVMLAHLARQNAELSRSVAKLHVMVGTFATALARSGAIDKDHWQQALAEIQRAFEALDPQPPPPPAPPAPKGGSPYRDGARPASKASKAKPAKAPVLCACVSCGAQVDVATTQMTERGAECEPCFRKAELARLEKG